MALSFVVDAMAPVMLPARATGSADSMPGWFVAASAPTLGFLAVVAVGRSLVKPISPPAAVAKRKTE